MVAHESGSTLIRTSLSGSERTISYSFLAPSVMEPSVFTSAAQPQRRETSRSVAAILTSPPRASASTLDRIGIEFFRSTIPWTSCSSFTRSLLRTVISMDACYLLLLTTSEASLSLTERDDGETVDRRTTGAAPATCPVYAGVDERARV